jgi:hypothetical protein
LCRELRGLKPTKANNKSRLTKTSLAADNMSEKKSKNLFKLKKDKDKDGKKGKMMTATNNDNFILCSRFLSDSPANMGMAVNGKPDIVHAFDGAGARSMKKSLSYSELSGDSQNFPNFKYHLNRRDKFNHQSALNLANDPEKRIEKTQPIIADPPGKHKVIIYFGDSIPNKGNSKQQKDAQGEGPKTISHAQRLFEEMRLERNNSILQKERQLQNLSNEKYVKNFTDEISDKTADDDTTDNFMLQLKSVLEQKQRGVKEESTGPPSFEDEMDKLPKLRKPPPIPAPVPPEVVAVVQPDDNEPSTSQQALPSYIESIVNGVINIKIEDNYQVASKLVAQLFDNSQATTATMASSHTSMSNKSDTNNFYCNSDDEGDVGSFDWGFVQDWRTRYCRMSKFTIITFIAFF